MAYSRFIFYSLFTFALVLAGYGFAPAATRDFLHNAELWREPLLAGALSGLGIALLGVYVLLNRIVFVSLALSQSAGLGIFFSFWLLALLGVGASSTWIPLGGGMLFALLGAGIFAWFRRRPNFSESSILALLYLLSSAGTLLLGDRIAQGRHDLENLLFGNAVTVEPGTLALLSVVTGILFLAHLWFRREFLYTSADPTFMKTRGLTPRVWSSALYLLIALGITVSLRTLGSLPVFALIVIPAWIALKQARGIAEAFVIALWIGTWMPALGYYFSYLFSLPTGACVILIGGFYLAAAGGEPLSRKRFKD